MSVHPLSSAANESRAAPHQIALSWYSPIFTDKTRSITLAAMIRTYSVGVSTQKSCTGSITCIGLLVLVLCHNVETKVSIQSAHMNEPTTHSPKPRFLLICRYFDVLNRTHNVLSHADRAHHQKNLSIKHK